MSGGLRPSGEFKPAGSFNRGKDAADATFAARHFAVRRAGFLLRELARQQEQPLEAELPEFATITPAEVTVEEVGAGGASMPRELMSFDDDVRGVAAGEVDRLVAEAEERGRASAAAEFASALDQAIAVLDASGRTLSQMQEEFERNMVVPVTRATIHIASELARQTLAGGDGLTHYLEAVTSSLDAKDRDGATGPISVRVNPDDLTILERAPRKLEHLRFVADAVVPRGGVIASSGDKVVDDRFENRLHEIREAVLSAAAELRREERL